MSGDLLTDAELAEELDLVREYSSVAGKVFAFPDLKLADRILAHVDAQSRRIAALNARHALPCPQCGHQRVPE